MIGARRSHPGHRADAQRMSRATGHWDGGTAAAVARIVGLDVSLRRPDRASPRRAHAGVRPGERGRRARV
jgi:hypothetical protein